MTQIISFLLLSLIAVAALLYILIQSIFHLVTVVKKKKASVRIPRIRKAAMLLAIVMVLNIGLIVFSQMNASTPGIKDINGNTPERSIAELLKVDLNGRKQWISIRGWDREKPVMLFLAGGPGGTQMSAVRHNLSELEKHFVVVNWDQVGAGKSYYAEPIKKITVETYIEDGHALTEYLSRRFGKEKIYIVGESWGSALGIFLLERFPESYHAFFGTGQMIDFAETERMDYNVAMEIAKERGDLHIVEKLKRNGVPPYYGKNLTWKSAVYLNYLSDYMTSNPAIHNPGYNTIRDINSSEYGILDKINYFRGVIDTFNHVYQKLYTTDLRNDYNELNVPVYFFIGKHDINAPTSLVEDYFDVLDAPEKEIVWFEHSGHNPWINESDRFVEELLKRCSEKITR